MSWLSRYSVDDDEPFGLEKTFLVIFGHTELGINPSRAKFDAEDDFDVRSAVAPPKPHQIHEKLIFRSGNFARNIFRCQIFARDFSFRNGIDRIDRTNRFID